MRHWGREGPPAYMAVAAYLGLRREKPVTVDTEQDLLNVLACFPGGERLDQA